MGSTPAARTSLRSQRSGERKLRDVAQSAKAGWSIQPPSYGWQASLQKIKGSMDDFHYVYTLESLSNPSQIYTGQTQDLRQRLKEHNSGQVPHTSKFTPWQIRSATVFRNKDRA
ncbi:MAG: GIY-YIG nuclease family protein, partial [Limisphaerales bacterium]